METFLELINKGYNYFVEINKDAITFREMSNFFWCSKALIVIWVGGQSSKQKKIIILLFSRYQINQYLVMVLEVEILMNFWALMTWANGVPKAWAKNSNWRDGTSTFRIYTFLLCYQSRLQVSFAGWGLGQPLNDSFGGSCKLLFKTAPKVDLLRQSTFLRKVVFIFCAYYWLYI